MLSIRLSPVLCLCLCLSLASRAFTPDDLDHLSVEGTVFDTSGAVIPGAYIEARQAATGLLRTATTDGAGRYRLASLPPGAYLIHAEAAGFRASIVESVRGAAGVTIRRDFELLPSDLAEQVTISAAITPAATIDTTRTVIGSAIERAEIDSLPVESRNPLDLLHTLAGVSLPALSTADLAEGESADRYRATPEEAGLFSLHGGAPYSNNLTIEGLDNNDDRAARERFIPSLDAVEEVQVITHQFSAEYGRASGGRVNLRLRGGTSDLHGRAFTYLRDARLNANAFHRNADPARRARLPFTEINPGASLGGPLLPGRAFFFAAYEYDRVSDRAEITALLPTIVNPLFPLPLPNGRSLGRTGVDRNGRPVEVNGGAEVGLYDLAIATPKNASTLQTRIDINAGERHRASINATLARQRDERGFPGGRRLLETLRPTGRQSESISASETFVVSPRAIAETRAQYSRLAPQDAPLGRGPVVLIETDDPRDVPGNPDANPFSRRGTLVAGSSTTAGVDRREQRFQLQERVMISAGESTLRAGFDLQRISSRYRDLSDATGTFTFASPADFLASRPARYEHRFETTSELGNTYFGLFLQGDWRARPNLTIALGLRWDQETILIDRNNFGPRISAAWDPQGEGRMVLRGGFGIFYNRALLRTIDDFSLTSRAILVDTNQPAGESVLAALQFPRVLGANDPLVKTAGIRETAFLRRLESGFRLPESYQASLGFERELGGGMKIEINYAFNRGAHLWREVNANAPRLPAGFASFTEYLIGRDFDNAVDPATGLRPITSTGNADIVRFNLSETASQTVTENARRVVIFGLALPSVSNTVSARRAALAALRHLRPDPALEQIEELQARGNSFYHGLSVSLDWRMASRGTLRAAYTVSRMIDDGVVNTSSPLVAGDFGRERAPSLLDARHRVNLSGQITFPARLGGVQLSGTFQLASPRPFNLGIGGNDRNLDDVNNDRPNFNGSIEEIVWRRPGEALDPRLATAFTLPLVGEHGNLPRNAGRGPWQHTLNLRLARRFRLRERMQLTPQIEAFNPLNQTIFSFGAEFVDYTPQGLGDFLVPARTVKPRTVRLGVRFEF